MECVVHERQHTMSMRDEQTQTSEDGVVSHTGRNDMSSMSGVEMGRSAHVETGKAGVRRKGNHGTVCVMEFLLATINVVYFWRNRPTLAKVPYDAF